MKKIPTLFKRDPENLKTVLPEVTPGCEWVIAGEGIATRKYDGTCVMLDAQGEWWGRREVKRAHGQAQSARLPARMIATSAPQGHVAYARLYDALREVDIRPDLTLTPDPAQGEKTGWRSRGWRGHAAAAITIHDPGSGPLVYSGTSMEHAARMVLAFAPERALDYGIRAALSAVRAQLELEEGGQLRDTLG